MESDIDESARWKIGRKHLVIGDGSVRKQLEQLKGRVHSLTGEVSFMQEEDLRLETTRARLSNLIKRHEVLAERLSRDSDKLVFERLQKEFEAARAAQTEEVCLDGEQWNDGLLATIRERVHMEADRKAMPGNVSMLPDPHFNGKTTYKAGNKKFIDYVGEILQAYVDRREQVRLIKELYGNQIGELYHSISFSWIEFVLEDFECKVTVSLRYADIISVLPTRIRVLAWPLHSSKKIVMSPMGIRKVNGPNVGQPIPARLSYAEDALRTMSLPEAYAEIVLNLPRALQQIFPYLDKNTSERSTGVVPLEKFQVKEELGRTTHQLPNSCT
ncbi:uncharacterized protein LOC131217199 isoform X5 [Magnolia sinica]|uniref:uncharacterized protein LOC131217199 isoform X5 n=1 Tax=Magnolia sinica TaxID=86752 RepID=UPI0026585D6F|nr:uncharacterized protein LOC131217199 isoform X5 [Magnolia sinica]